mmetsp:Transcript_2591/g.5581  ORF Transcript_2591/g.5581 Transcript_2591/m.5581 type:complete len:445 (+) Transcript_2591:709-2043(+)
MLPRLLPDRRRLRGRCRRGLRARHFGSLSRGGEQEGRPQSRAVGGDLRGDFHRGEATTRAGNEEDCRRRRRYRRRRRRRHLRPLPLPQSDRPPPPDPRPRLPPPPRQIPLQTRRIPPGRHPPAPGPHGPLPPNPRRPRRSHRRRRRGQRSRDPLPLRHQLRRLRGESGGGRRPGLAVSPLRPAVRSEREVFRGGQFAGGGCAAQGAVEARGGQYVPRHRVVVAAAEGDEWEYRKRWQQERRRRQRRQRLVGPQRRPGGGLSAGFTAVHRRDQFGIGGRERFQGEFAPPLRRRGERCRCPHRQLGKRSARVLFEIPHRRIALRLPRRGRGAERRRGPSHRVGDREREEMDRWRSEESLRGVSRRIGGCEIERRSSHCECHEFSKRWGRLGGDGNARWAGRRRRNGPHGDGRRRGKTAKTNASKENQQRRKSRRHHVCAKTRFLGP